jgi:hypothetical protein
MHLMIYPLLKTFILHKAVVRVNFGPRWIDELWIIALIIGNLRSYLYAASCVGKTEFLQSRRKHVAQLFLLRLCELVRGNLNAI